MATEHRAPARVEIWDLPTRLFHWALLGAVVFSIFAIDVLDDAVTYHGHNPLGALSVVAMLASLIVQVITGLAADDEIFTTGPLVNTSPVTGSIWPTRFTTGINRCCSRSSSPTCLQSSGTPQLVTTTP